ncbi:hypothetical protein [Phenylobacterium soli]|uniref:Uncharacterized protein n=1 Tax=Phenylobacterium soli TaxID=2170551 RepID=A0A328AAE0_9CAUL|nr:hypothetical protein [Phenylobacterium soli]RAK51703.1 hypothetical protein DJ017_17880 [Phenylobacterium soli]
MRATPSGLTAEASVFEGYMRRARGIDASFSGPAEVSEALQTGAAGEPRQLESGMIAYAAVAALQEPRFVDGLRGSRADRGDLARRLASDPAYALELPGGEAAAARAAGALASQGEALRAQGLKVKRAAYSVQHQAWSKRNVPDPRGRLARVKQLSSEPMRGGEDAARLYAAMAEGGRRGGAASPAVTRAVAVAALNVLGQEGRGRALMSEPRTASCLRIAKLNLYQCLAAAGPQYEDIFCLGEHAMAETGSCVADATRASRVSYRR